MPLAYSCPALSVPYFSRASCTARDYPPLRVYIEIFPAYCTCICAYMYKYVCVCVCVISGKVSRGNAALQRSNFSAPLTFFPGPEFPRFGFHCICGTRNLPPGLNYASSRYLCDTISILIDFRLESTLSDFIKRESHTVDSPLSEASALARLLEPGRTP